MPMDPVLRAMLDTPVSFMARVGTGIEGQVVYGAATSPVVGRLDWLRATRTLGPRGEPTGPSGTIFLDSPDFDPAVVPVGSLVVLPDDQTAAIVSIQSWSDAEDSTVISHWELVI